MPVEYLGSSRVRVSNHALTCHLHYELRLLKVTITHTRAGAERQSIGSDCGWSVRIRLVESFLKSSNCRYTHAGWSASGTGLVIARSQIWRPRRMSVSTLEFPGTPAVGVDARRLLRCDSGYVKFPLVLISRVFLPKGHKWNSWPTDAQEFHDSQNVFFLRVQELLVWLWAFSTESVVCCSWCPTGTCSCWTKLGGIITLTSTVSSCSCSPSQTPTNAGESKNRLSQQVRLELSKNPCFSLFCCFILHIAKVAALFNSVLVHPRSLDNLLFKKHTVQVPLWNYAIFRAQVFLFSIYDVEQITQNEVLLLSWCARLLSLFLKV